MTRRQPPETRARILAAAEALSCEVGAIHVSIEAVAARAGVSKGGLLYHFPTKHDLLRALVAEHVGAMSRAMRSDSGEPDCALDAARAYLRIVRAKLDRSAPPLGLFAAIAEDPGFIAPLRDFRKSVLDDVFRRCPDPDLAAVVFYACEGLLHVRLTDAQTQESPQEAAERSCVFDTLEGILSAQALVGCDAE